jgi:hypothetical protein
MMKILEKTKTRLAERAGMRALMAAKFTVSTRDPVAYAAALKALG